jgi:cell division septation protein DedD
VTQRLFDDDDSPPGRGYTRDPDRSDPGRGADREISLGAPAILGIFFALTLICACFFGFGYTMGRKSAQAATADATTTASDATSSNGSSKPAAGSLASQPGDSAEPATQPVASDSTTPSAAPAEPAPTAPTPLPAAQKNAATPADGMIVGDKPPQPAPAATSKPPTSNQQPAAAPAGTIMVQIAAVSSQDVADILLASLKKKGYSVSARHEPQDKLLHVQIGPFADRKDAEAMQQRVLADGFNAIVK